MSTRATVHFEEGKTTVAIVYRHADGYPEGLGADLKEFFQSVERQTRDTRFTDASYLAAKFVVWQAQQCGRNTLDYPLDFLNVGVVLRDPSDIAYRYHVHCDGPGVPNVTVDRVV